MSKIVKIIVILLIISAVAFGIYKYKVYIDDKNIGVKIESISKYNYFIYKNSEGLSGVIDNKGKIIIEPKYDNVKIPNPTKDVFICYEGSKKIYVKNSNGDSLFQNYNSVEPIKLKNIASDLVYEKSVLKYEQDGKYGLIDFSGNKVTENIYDSIENLQYREGYLIVSKNNKFGIINIEGKVLVQPNYDEVRSDEFETDANRYKYSGYIVLNKENDGFKFGYIDYKGNTIIEPKYNDLLRESVKNEEKDAFLLVSNNGKYGLFKNNKKLVDFEYQNIEYKDSANVFLLQKLKKYGVANIKGKLIIPAEYDNLEVNGIYSYVKKDNTTTVYNDKGKVQKVDPSQELYKVDDGKYYISINNSESNALYGILDKNKKELVKSQYMYIEYVFDDYFIVSTKEGYGLISSDGTVKIKPENASVQKLLQKNALQVLKYNSSITEVYSKNISKTCEMENGKIELQDSFIKIYSDKDTKYLDNDGNTLVISKIEPDINLFVSKNNNLWGFVDRNGKQVVENKYDRTTEFNKYGYAAIKKDGLWGSIDVNGNIIVEPKYKLPQDIIEADFIDKYFKVEYGIGEFYYTDKVNQ